MGKIYKQSSIEERALIQTQLAMGVKPTAIAMGLNRSASTISRELHRNGWRRRFASGGVEALKKDRPRAGRPPRVDAAKVK
ncbi:MAG: hypothetical protein B7X29_10715, partial [Halothiobacillus sp. 13-55-115]